MNIVLIISLLFFSSLILARLKPVTTLKREMLTIIDIHGHSMKISRTLNTQDFFQWFLKEMSVTNDNKYRNMK